MSTAVEITSVPADFLYHRLSTYSEFATLGSKGVHDLFIPQVNTEAERILIYPCILIGTPVWDEIAKGNGNVIIWANGRFEVTAIGLAEQFRTLEQIAGRFYPLLHGYSGAPPSGGYINSCDWIRPVKSPQTTSGLTFLRIGGLYRIKARLSSS